MPKPMRPLQAPRGWLRHAGIYWLPPLLWMAVMFVLSTDMFAAEHTGSMLWYVFSELAPHATYEQYTLLHFLTRKAAHLTEYAILACLLLRAFRAGAAVAWRWRWALLSLLLVAVHAVLDKYHQAFTQYRTSSVADSMLDMAGGLIVLTLLWLRSQRRKTAKPLPPALRCRGERESCGGVCHRSGTPCAWVAVRPPGA
jgi:VanZ family protein